MSIELSETGQNGTNTTAVSTTNSVFTSLVSGAGSAVFDNSWSIDGGLSLHSIGPRSLRGPVTGGQHKITFYGRMAALPASNSIFATGRLATALKAQLRYNSSGTISLINISSQVSVTTTTVAALEVFRIDWTIDKTGATQTMSVFKGANLHSTTPTETITGAFTASDLDDFGVSAFQSGHEMWMDRLVVDTTTMEGPYARAKTVTAPGAAHTTRVSATTRPTTAVLPAAAHAAASAATRRAHAPTARTAAHPTVTAATRRAHQSTLAAAGAPTQSDTSARTGSVTTSAAAVVSASGATTRPAATTITAAAHVTAGATTRRARTVTAPACAAVSAAQQSEAGINVPLGAAAALTATVAAVRTAAAAASAAARIGVTARTTRSLTGTASAAAAVLIAATTTKTFPVTVPTAAHTAASSGTVRPTTAALPAVVIVTSTAPTAAWLIWDGSASHPGTPTLWNGVVEQPVTTEITRT